MSHNNTAAGPRAQEKAGLTTVPHLSVGAIVMLEVPRLVITGGHEEIESTCGAATNAQSHPTYLPVLT